MHGVLHWKIDFNTECNMQAVGCYMHLLLDYLRVAYATLRNSHLSKHVSEGATSIDGEMELPFYRHFIYWL